jgi:parallel beta-helix repeat protein
VKRRGLIAAATMLPGAAAAQPDQATALPDTAHNIRAFGAVGDGVADDTGAIQAALDQALAVGGAVFIPDGVYRIGGALRSHGDHQRIVGAGWNARLLRADGNNGPLLTLAGRGSFVSALTVDGNGGSGAVRGPDVGLAGADSTAAELNMLNAGLIGIGIAADRCTIRNCTITGLAIPDIQSYGIWAIADNAGTMIRDNHITGTGIDAIGVSGTGFAVTGNYVANCHAHVTEGGGQVAVYDNTGRTRNGVLTGNVIGRGNSRVSGGMELAGRNISVTGNTVADQNFFGINIDSGSGFLFEGNVVSNCGQAYPGTDAAPLGAALTMFAGVADFHIFGNRFADDQAVATQTCGVFVPAGVSDRYSIVGNVFSGMRMAPVIDGGTGLNRVIRDNFGIDDVIPAVSAAASLALPLNPVVALTGRARVAAFTGPAWTGRTITLLPAQAMAFAAGGNIANAVTAPAGGTVTGVFDGQVWRLR